MKKVPWSDPYNPIDREDGIIVPPWGYALIEGGTNGVDWKGI